MQVRGRFGAELQMGGNRLREDGSRWYKLVTSWKESILLKIAYVKIMLYSCQDKVGVCFGDH